MTTLFGNITLVTALIFTIMQSILPMIGHYRRNHYLTAFARPAAIGQFVCVLTAYILLTMAFVQSDFSIAYVAANSHPALPLMYRLTAVWGAHEGSILLWILVINVWTMAFACSPLKDDRYPLTISILGFISLCFLCFLLLTSNPFTAATQLLQGADLNPLLQDPGFVIHPPMLYIGYVGFSTAFAITLAALIDNKLDTQWARITRNYAIAAWCFLTFGITLGSWWAYRVLGWGGFWFWDPVENASLLPWICGTALIHVLLLTEKRGSAKNWACILSLICFMLSVLGTFLVRSGVLVSAHTFASDPARGIFLLVLLAVLSVAALAIYISRIPLLVDRKPFPFSFLSRETSLLLNSILLFIALITVLLGTLYPLILDALLLGSISVGAPYFNTVMFPIILIMMFAMGAGALCRWQEDTMKNLWRKMRNKLVISFLCAIALLWMGTGHPFSTALFGLTLCMWIIVSVSDRQTYRLIPGMALAHTGFAVLIIGILLSSGLSQEREVRIKPGNAVTLGPYQFFFVTTEGVGGSNYRGIRGTFEVLKGSRHIVNMHPEKRIYLVRDMVMTTVDIHPGIFRDLYIALGEPLDDDYWSVRLYYKPFMRWVWTGGILMILGGVLALMQRKQLG